MTSVQRPSCQFCGKEFPTSTRLGRHLKTAATCLVIQHTQEIDNLRRQNRELVAENDAIKRARKLEIETRRVEIETRRVELEAKRIEMKKYDIEEKKIDLELLKLRSR